MKRTKYKDLKLPDAIYRCKEKSNFTQVPNLILRDPNISAKAKAILSILLSNKQGWITHVNKMETMMKEGRDFINSGLTELQKNGYFLRLLIRDKKTKVRKGSFFAYTDVAYNFDYHKNKAILEKKGYEIYITAAENVLQTGDTFVGNSGKTAKNTAESTACRRICSTNVIPVSGESATNNTIINKKRTNKEIPSGISSKQVKSNLPDIIFYQDIKYKRLVIPLQDRTYRSQYKNEGSDCYEWLDDEQAINIIREQRLSAANKKHDSSKS